MVIHHIFRRCTSSPRFLCRPTAFCSISDVRALSIRKTADLPLQLWVGTFPRFVAIGFYFLSETLNINRFTNHFSIHSQPSYPQKVVLHSITARFCFRPYHSTFIFKHLSRDFETYTITAMYHGRLFAYMILPCPK